MIKKLYKRVFSGRRFVLSEWEVDLLALVFLVIGVVIGVILVSAGLIGNTAAEVLTWSQTDWTGGQTTGVVADDVNTFSGSSNIVTTEAGQIELQKNYNLGKFRGNSLLSGSTNLNVASYSSLSFVAEQDFDDDYFSYSNATASRITFDQAGDYLVSATVPIVSSDVNNNRSAVEIQLRRNGSAVVGGNGRSSYTRNDTNHNEASNHVNLLVTGVNAGDYIEVYVRGYANSSNVYTSDFALYTEYIGADKTAYSATATAKASGGNLNTASSPLLWDSNRSDSGYTHTSGSGDVTLDSAGDYFVAVNIPLFSTSQRPNITGRVRLDGAEVPGGRFQQGYIRNDDGHNRASIHWAGIVRATGAGQVLTITAENSANGGTVTVGSEAATLYVERMPATGVIGLTGTQSGGDNDYNESSPEAINWATSLVTDTSIYTHEPGASNENITLNAGGDYLVAVNIPQQANSQRTNLITQIRLDGTPVTAARSASGYIRNASGHNESSNMLLFPLTSLSGGETLTVTVQQEAGNGDVNDDGPASIMIWYKGLAPEGTLTSNVFDPLFDSNWGDLTFTSSGSGTVTVKARSAAADDMTGAPDWSTCDGITSATDISGNNCVDDGERYFQYRVELQPDGANSPIFEEISVDYESSDATPPPTNATNVAITGIADGDWTNTEPTFTWDPGVDNVGGDGIYGYCIALDEVNPGASASLDPEITGGVLAGLDDGVERTICPYMVLAETFDLSTVPGLDLVSGQQYYFSIKAFDLGGNIWTGLAADYQDIVSFRYDGTAPNNPSFISLPSNFISTRSVTFAWPAVGAGSPSDDHSGLAGLQYRIGETGTWYGDLHNGAEDLTDLLANDGFYTTNETYDYPVLVEGINEVFLRTVDNVGNTSEPLEATLKINTSAPSGVRNLTVTPADNTANSYAFSWESPTTFTGTVNNITYCYSVNTLPNEATCNYTAPGVTSLDADAFATQPGTNTMYIVARGEAGNINYDTFETRQFTYSGTAPGIPTGIDIADISIKAREDWKLALSWSAPDDVGAGVASYRVYRSLTNTTCSSDFSAFEEVGSANGTSFVDGELTEETYYYCLRACDSANNCSALSGTVNELPTGKFTEPANLITEPEVFALTTRRAVINWTTDRNSDSRIQFGLASGEYFEEEVGSSEQTLAHTVTLSSLEPGVTYFYRATWTDEDGNTGVSEEKTFTTDPPPEVVNSTVSNIGINSAIVNFTVRNSTSANLLFGPSENFGGSQEIGTAPEESTYSARLDNLQDGTTYFFAFVLQDADDNEYNILQTNQFTTLPQPQVTDVAVEEVRNTAQPTVRVVWQSNVPLTSVVSYDSAGQPEPQNLVDLERKTEHELVIQGLLPNTNYDLTVSGTDGFGNEAVSDDFSFTTATDSRPPGVFNVVVEGGVADVQSDSDNTAQLVVSWETDELASSQVSFGEGTLATFTQSTQIDNEGKTRHLVVISNLRHSSVYHLKVISRDEVGNETESNTVVTITPRKADDAFQLVLQRLGDIFGFLL